jgi:hypothetical protein
LETDLQQFTIGGRASTQIKGAEIMETVLSVVLLGALGIAIMVVVIYAVIAFLMDSWEIK